MYSLWCFNVTILLETFDSPRILEDADALTILLLFIIVLHSCFPKLSNITFVNYLLRYFNYIADIMTSCIASIGHSMTAASNLPSTIYIYMFYLYILYIILNLTLCFSAMLWYLYLLPHHPTHSNHDAYGKK